MRHGTIREATELYRRSGTARRTLTRAPLVPSQDVSRYQARTMSAPIYGLDRRERSTPVVAIRARRLAVGAIASAIVLIQRMGAWIPRQVRGVPDST